MPCCCKVKNGHVCKLRIRNNEDEKYCWIHRSQEDYAKYGGRSSRGGKGCTANRQIQRKSCPTRSEKLSKHINNLLRKWQNELVSGGSNNATTFSGLKRVVDAMHAVRPFTSRSAFVDMGSGAGIACIYVAMRFGCKTYGIEYDSELVSIAKQYSKASNVEDLCSFEDKDFTEKRPVWFENRGITHTFTYDGVFSSNVWNPLFQIYSDVPQRLVGCSVSKFKRYWPENITAVGSSIPGIKLAGGKSSFSFQVWEKTRNK